jgi:O-antigen ligase
LLLPIRLGLLLGGWILLLTYNRQYYSFDGLYGNYESQGLYWIPADAALLTLAAFYGFHLWRQRPSSTVPWSLIRAIAPFLIAAALATLTATHIPWAFAEWFRWAKLTLLVVLLWQVAVGTTWWMAIAALGLAVTLQSTLGLLQVVMNTTTGLMSMFTGGGPSAETVVAGFSETGRARASGTMVHPNIFGPYLIFLMPIFLALFLDARDRWVRYAAVVVCAAGYLGLLGSMSRLPIAIAAMQAGLVVICLVAFRGASLKKIAALTGFVGIVVGVASLYFADEIVERLTGDFSESLSFRSDYNRVAIEIWREHPLFGVGLNNFAEGLREHDAKLSTIVDEMQEGRTKFGVRAAAPVHNVYLLVLAETGLVGLAAFVALLGTAIAIAWRSALHTSGSIQLVCFGIAIGFFGQYLQQTMDFSMWMDPGLFTFALLLVLAARAPEVDATAVLPYERPPIGTRPEWSTRFQESL